jgi:hypothetical protein
LKGDNDFAVLLHICDMLDEPTESIRSAIETFERMAKFGHPRASKAPNRRDLLLSEWLRRDIPPRDFLLGELLSTTSRWIVYGETGIGKTLWALDLAAAIATGECFLHWAGSGKRRRVMYLDGELPAETFKERLEIIAQRYGYDIELYAYNRDVLNDGDMPPLNTPAGEKWLWREIDAVKPDAIVSDSIMCLLEGSMSEEESWAPIKAMIRKISGRRVAQIWLHHTGHDPSKGFGTKTREWEMDTVVSLTDDDGSILMEFKKARLRKPETREQFEPKKIACNADGWAIVGGAAKRRGPRSDNGDILRNAIMDAYRRLADGADTMPECCLELHPTKTKIVYCRDGRRKGKFENVAFDFLGYGFRPRSVKGPASQRMLCGYTPAVSKPALNAMRSKIRSMTLRKRTEVTLDDIARELNPITRGWIAYYGRYTRSALYPLVRYIDQTLAVWIKRKYKRFHRRLGQAREFLTKIARESPRLFVHWQLGASSGLT